MKTKILSLCMLLACVLPAEAQQRQKASVDYSIVVELEHFGKLNYSYIIGDEGDVEYDGPVSINAKRNVSNFHPTPFSAAINFNGTYTLHSSCKKGYLNGPLTLNVRQSMTTGGKSGTRVSTFSGNYTNGVPNGAFNVNIKSEIPYKMSAHFKNGELVGAYSFDGFAEDHRGNDYPLTIKGTLTPQGVLDGPWIYHTAFTQTSYTFKNGILTAWSDKNSGMKPATSALARQYAAGTITEEELMEKNHAVVEKEFDLDEATKTALCCDYIEFDKIAQHYTFNTSNIKKYKEVMEIPLLTSKGYKFLEDKIIRAAKTDDLDSIQYIHKASYWDCVAFDSVCKHYYFETYYYEMLYKEKFVTCKIPNRRVYLRNSEIESINHTVDSVLCSEARTASDLFNFENYVPKNMVLDSLSIEKLDAEIKYLAQKKQDFLKLKPAPNNDKYFLYKYKDKDGYTHIFYLNKESVNDLDISICKFKEVLIKKQEIEAQQKKAAEAEAQALKAKEKEQELIKQQEQMENEEKQKKQEKKKARKKKMGNFLNSLIS